MSYSNIPYLTPARVRSAYAVAIVTDLLQFALGPLGWAGIDQALDVITAVVEWRLLGFPPFLRPTFIIPFLLMFVIDMINGFHFLYPSIPLINLRFIADVSQWFTAPPWNTSAE